MNQSHANSSMNDGAALGQIDLARAVLADPRSLSGWERESLDEFTWAEISCRPGLVSARNKGSRGKGHES